MGVMAKLLWRIGLVPKSQYVAEEERGDRVELSVRRSRSGWFHLTSDRRRKRT